MYRDQILKSKNKPNPVKVNFDSIPLVCRDKIRWVLWNWTWNEKEQRWTKPPFRIVGPWRASSTNPATWGTLDRAKLAYESGNADGIGFVLGDGYLGIDLDDCRDPESGVIEPWAETYMSRLHSYTEISPSGTGIKVFV